MSNQLFEIPFPFVLRLLLRYLSQSWTLNQYFSENDVWVISQDEAIVLSSGISFSFTLSMIDLDFFFSFSSSRSAWSTTHTHPIYGCVVFTFTLSLHREEKREEKKPVCMFSNVCVSVCFTRERNAYRYRWRRYHSLLFSFANSARPTFVFIFRCRPPIRKLRPWKSNTRKSSSITKGTKRLM